MAGRLILERLSCNATALSGAGTYVRAVLNEAVVPFPSCQKGPGYSCPLSNYTAMFGPNSSLPKFVPTCGIPKSYPQYLEFFWNWNRTNALDYQNGTISYQESYTTD